MSYAELCQHSPEIKKAFFDLGWDYFSAKQGLPNDVNEYIAFLEGYNAAKERIKPVRADRFHLKWLQIRYGALKRNRIFDVSVTPEAIRKIDVSHCPITLAPLTHSTFTETDWSIDRVSNAGGYTMGNLVVVSTKANKAKGTMSFDDILLCSESTESTNGLTPLEWKRWVAICSLNGWRKKEDGYSVGFYCAPFIIECPPMMIMNPSSILQYVIAMKAYGYRDTAIYSKIGEGLPKSLRQTLNGLVRDAVKCRNMVHLTELDVWLNKSLFNHFITFFESLTQEHHRIIMSNFSKARGGGAQKVRLDNPAWNPELQGYNPHA